MFTGIVSAQINLRGGGGQFSNVEGVTIAALVTAVISFILVIAALVFFFMLLWGGLSWILAGGDKGKTEEARNRITGALVGLVIVFSAWAILQLAEAFLGVDFGALTIPTIGGGAAPAP